jgi:YihY family inner membrane protein
MPEAIDPRRRLTPEGAAPSAGSERLSPGLAAAHAAPVESPATWQQVKALAGYMTKTEVHTYAFSVAAQVILSLFPFIVMLITIAHRVFHSDRMVAVVIDLMSHFLPGSPHDQDFVMRNMRVVAYAHARVTLYSLFMLFVTTTGVFLPLEVALNSVWGVRKNRSYLMNQVVSLGLAIGVSLLALISVALSAAQQSVLEFLFFHHVDNVFFRVLTHGFMDLCAIPASIGLFFLIYWGLPNRRIPPRSVLPTAIVVGLLWEVGKYIYILALPHLDFHAIYGPFYVSVGLIMWAFISGLLLLAGAYVSATRESLREARAADIARGNESTDDRNPGI